MLLSMGGNDGGISLYVQQGKLCFVHSIVDVSGEHVVDREAEMKMALAKQ